MRILVWMESDKARGCELQGVSSVPRDVFVAALEKEVAANVERLQVSHDSFHGCLGFGVGFCTFSGSIDNGKGCIVRGIGNPDNHTKDGDGNKQFKEGEAVCVCGSLHASESRGEKEKPCS